MTPPSFAASLAAGQKALVSGREAGALRQGTALVAKFPKRYEGYRLVGDASFGLDQPDRAEAAFRQALRLSPVAVRPTLEGRLHDVVSLRLALSEVARARMLKASGDVLGAAQAEEAAYRALPSRTTYGLAAAELDEAVGRFDEARKLLAEIHDKDPSAANVTERLAAVEARIEDRQKQQAAKRADDDRHDEARRARSEARRRAAEERRIEAQKEADRLAEEERQRAEKARQDQAETDRLNGVLEGQRRAVSDAEGAARQAREAVDDAEGAVRKADHEADEARSRRDDAKRKKDDLEGKVRDAKGDLARQLAQNELRGAENAYNEAKDEYDRRDHRLSEARSRRDQAQSDADDARRKLEQARQDARDTEAAIQRIASGG